MNNLNIFLQNYLNAVSNSILSSDIKSVDKAANVIIATIKRKGTIYVCGNGGSAAIANHYVCDFLKFFRQKSKYLPKIISLCNSIETITAIDSFKILGMVDSRSKMIFTPSQNHLAICGSILVVFKIFGILPIFNSSLISLYNDKILGFDSSPSFTNGIHF